MYYQPVHTKELEMTDTAARVLMSISDNQGYAPDQINSTISLGDLLEQVEQAVKVFGEDALVVLANGQRYGAGYGAIPPLACEDLFVDPNDEGDDYY